MNIGDQRSNCPGYLDEFGIWNNGFECPSIGNQIRVCCGSDSRRYCCILQQITNYTTTPMNKSFLSYIEAHLPFIKKFDFSFLTLPIQLICIFIIFLFLLLILIVLFICIRSHQQKKQFLDEENLSTTRTHENVDHFPFPPPHHQLYYQPNSQFTKDTLTTSMSSTSVRLPSDFYVTDRKSSEQIRHANELKKYLYQQEDIIV